MESKGGPAPDAIFECLADATRRDVLDELRDRGASALDELAASVGRGEGKNGDRAERLELALHHRHVPKLVAAGLAEYDREARVVEPTERTAIADVVAQTVEECGTLSPGADSMQSERARLE